MSAHNGVNNKTVAFCGTRGLPANYGGFETAVDEISKHFAESGYDCVVFCWESSGSQALKYHEGRRLACVKGRGVTAWHAGPSRQIGSYAGAG